MTRQRPHWIAFPLLALGLLLTACASEPEHLWLKSPGWSRARLIHNTRVGDPVPVAIDDRGGLYLFFFSPDEDSSLSRVMAFDRSGRLAWDNSYAQIELAVPSRPKLVWFDQALHLFWLSDDQLFTAVISPDGHLAAGPEELSAGVRVADYDISTYQGRRLAVWFAGPRQAPGVYALDMGKPRQVVHLVDSQGTRPDIQFDVKGDLHVVWGRYPPGPGPKPFFYAAYPGGGFEAGRGEGVVTPSIVGTAVLEGPKLGLTDQHAYVLWSTTFYSGSQAGTAAAQYASLPLGEPAFVSPARRLLLPDEYQLPYQGAPQRALFAGPRVPLGQRRRRSSDYVVQLAPNPSPHAELAVAVQSRLAFLHLKRETQVAAVFFQDGAPTSYQLLSFTAGTSNEPFIASDEHGYLYLTWLEKGELPGWVIYLASTAPAFQEQFSHFTRDDVARVAADSLFGLVSGAMMVPFALIWVLPGMIVLAVASRILPRGEDLPHPAALISLVIALAAYWLVKINFLPGMLEYVPFSAWFPFIPPDMGPSLRVLVPAAIAGLGVFAGWLYARRSASASAFLFMIVYSVVDSLLTLAIYGVLLLAAF